MKNNNESVLVVARNIIIPRSWTGVSASRLKGFTEIIRQYGQFRRRSEVEEDPCWQQIIPYLVFRYQDQYFLMQRTNQGTEERLHNLYTLGIGGHVRKEDLGGETIIEWAKREFEEEIDYQGHYVNQELGLLNDESNEVGHVHLGYVILLEGDSDQIKIREENKLSGELKTLDEVAQIYPQMESWSKLVFDFLKNK
jgi:predicted NUDIX family phosphoesterase